ncbi:replication protein A (plasmid) [Calothrix sp. NIES-4101]|nr:replication protein A [Calothrix sp. NIES-4101]
MWRARFFQALPSIISDYPDAQFIFLTLTVRNCEVDQLRSHLDWMNKSWQRLIQRRCFPALGCIRTTEVTRSALGRAHPHFHAILMVNPDYFRYGYISQANWRLLWKDCLRVDYNPVVRIEAIKGKLGEVDSLDDEFLGGVCEVLKYSVKPQDLVVDKEWLEVVTTQLRKSRAVSVTGVFKQYISEKEPEDLIGEEQEPSEESSGTSVYFKWKQKVQKYCKLPN